MSTRVGTANVKFTLGLDAAARILSAQMADTDTTILNEWNGTHREKLLAATGKLLRPWATVLRLPVGRRPDKGWVWAQCLGVAVGMDATRFRVRRARRLALYKQRVVNRKFGSTRLPHRFAVTMLAVDRVTGEKVAVMGFHFPAGVEGRHGYQSGEPARVDGHKDARRTIEREAARLVRRGWTVYTGGDTNYSNLQLAGLVSCWGKRGPGTHERRTIDSIYSDRGPLEVPADKPDASDHDRVVAVYP